MDRITFSYLYWTIGEPFMSIKNLEMVLQQYRIFNHRAYIPMSQLFLSIF